MQLRWIVLGIFTLTYAFLCLSCRRRALGVWIGIALMALARLVLAGQDPAGALTPRAVVFDAVSWNVLGVLAGAMLIADLFMASGVPLLLADLIVDHCRTTRLAIVGVCLFSGLISAFVDNVTTVLLVSPIALAISQRTQVSPVPILIGIAVSANLQGAATLIGDPPSMLLAGAFRLSFNDFFFHAGKPSLFFAMQVGAAASAVVLFLVFRRHRQPMEPVEVVKPKTWVPVGFIVVMIAFLASSSRFDPDFRWLAGTGNLILGTVAFAWGMMHEPGEAKQILKRYEFPTMFLLAGIFVLAYAMDRFGWVKAIAEGIANLVGGNQFAAYTLIVWISVLVSAFVDNIAYVALMLPVTKTLAAAVGGDAFLYASGLLIGACIGGNITPIGASCNVVAVGVLRREGHAVTFGQFARIGLPFTLAATTAAYLFVWAFWG
ncbi:MAG TPA: SLC13 family permease [Planctomycetota bacterium]|nr:SLC13 family permease [Planctomycetota bacterium]HRR81576.1 SLC13 family permease [Planctomycetota bacterium]HRT94871.1 SLC13 family permease [Planctomycetota bacterium]